MILFSTEFYDVWSLLCDMVHDSGLVDPSFLVVYVNNYAALFLNFRVKSCAILMKLIFHFWNILYLCNSVRIGDWEVIEYLSLLYLYNVYPL